MKVLVSAVSRYGATQEIASAIKAVLGQSGHDVDLCAPEDVASVEPYDAVVIGSGVHAGRWLTSARELIEREATHLLERPVWLFSSGPIGNPPKPSQEPPDGISYRELTKAVDHQVFEGKLDRRALGFGEKAVLEWARWIAVALSNDTAPSADGTPLGVAGGFVL